MRIVNICVEGVIYEFDLQDIFLFGLIEIGAS